VVRAQQSPEEYEDHYLLKVSRSILALSANENSENFSSPTSMFLAFSVFKEAEIQSDSFLSKARAVSETRLATDRWSWVSTLFARSAMVPNTEDWPLVSQFT